jgi:hypothetical protein
MLSRGFDSLPASRIDARMLAAKQYFTGQPCRRGHVAPRYTSTNQCTECQLEHARKNGGWNARPSRAEFLTRARKLVEDQGGVLFDKKFITAKSKLRACCSRGHEFKISYDHLRRGDWCRNCGNGTSARKRIRHTPDQLAKWAFHNHGGACLTTELVRAHARVLWKCSNPKHEAFEMTISNVIHGGAWCPACWRERRQPPQPPIPKGRLERIVQRRGGEITEILGMWRGSKTRLIVRCANGHEWTVNVANLVYAESWCPKCLYKGERIVRAIFETTFADSFSKSKPTWLLSDVGHKLELDGYNERLQLAFEYQGPHHYKLESVRAHDAIKRRLCSQQGVRLIEIEAIKRPFPPQNVLKKVAEAFRLIGLEQVPLLPLADMFPNELRQLQRLANDRGGSLVSSRYAGNEHHEWKCGNPDHPSWWAQPSNIRKPSWCPSCAGNRRLGIDGLSVWGEGHGLRLLDAEYRGTMQIHNWQCLKAGHTIRRSKSNIEQSVSRGIPACAVCAGTSRVTIEEIAAQVAERDWKLISEAYLNPGALLQLTCSQGHPFSRSWNGIQQGGGCRVKGCPDKRAFGKLRRA